MNTKVAVITGASQGIGKEIAYQLAEDGYNLALISRNNEVLLEISELLSSKGCNVLPIPCDISDINSVRSAINQVINYYQKIDILICNAGIGVYNSLQQTSDDEWNKILSVNINGTFFITREVVKHMVKSKSGYVLFIGSEAGKQGFKNLSSYCFSKFGINGFAASLSKECKKYGIRVGVINSGLVNTESNSNIISSMKSTWLQPNDIAKIVQMTLNLPDHVVLDEISVHSIHHRL
ncbi:hypothetical protein C8Z91_34860 [Paenibacillus elgii]|uniref:Short-chain dehydrogenase n=1 Tax=Paenibacillus elgii TaxID=189691 RepID=A0A2T6FRW9_9BACL|nr:SDR family oxidoreductase [Paenibacillus elgii]PUA34649.1 hypothetical protein C8Z91_34860 [Paenibacillus elgii]